MIETTEAASPAHQHLAAHMRRKVQLRARQARIAGRSKAEIEAALAYMEVACRKAVQGKVEIAWRRFERDVRVLRDKTRGPIQVGGYASREDPVLVDIVQRFEAGEALPITTRRTTP